MAKTKQAPPAEESPADALERLAAQITSQFGEGIIQDGDAFLGEERRVIPWSPALDDATGGGVIEGSWMSLAGPDKVGKTTSVLDFCATCQKPEHGARDIFYLAIEARLKAMNLTGTSGLVASKFKLVRSTPERILSTEDWLTICENILRAHRQPVIVLDSVSRMCSSGQLAEDVGHQDRGSGYKIISNFIDRNASVVPLRGAIVIFIAQIYANTSGRGKAKIERIPSAIRFQTDYQLLATHAETLETAQGRQFGKKIHWLVNSSALGPPGECASIIRFGHGIDKVLEVIQLARDFGLVELKGSWYHCPFVAACPELGLSEAPKFQGEAKLYEHLSARPDWVAAMQREIRRLKAGR